MIFPYYYLRYVKYTMAPTVYVVKAAISIGSNILIFVFFNILYPKWFISYSVR